ncbi:MAG: GNAT family N-acetyltransferase [Anaerolineae bacterium]|nr:GNAT family N-acetyltransferase [Anaerolineae bacterium]
MNILDFYRQLGPNSDPGPYGWMLNDLPDSLPTLCELVKRQLIHPSQRKEFRGALPPGGQNEDARFTAVPQMLAALHKRNEAGLVMSRPSRQRLIVSCRYHALLLAAILKHRGVPARLRVGFAEYVSDRKGKYVDHWICEVWSDAEGRWLLIDPDTKMVDIPRPDFKMAGDVWLSARQGFTYPSLYGVGRRWGWEPIRQNLIHDFEACLNLEPAYGDGPPLFRVKKSDLTQAQGQLLDEMAHLLQDPDVNLEALIRLQQENDLLQREPIYQAATAVTTSLPPTQPLMAETGLGPITLERARSEDAKALALLSWKAFDDDVNYGAPQKGGPPGYRSDKWQAKIMQAGDYYKVVAANGRIIGGAIIFPQANGVVVLGRIFIQPEVQRQGVGAAVMCLLETLYPAATRWQLDTPTWNKRNHAFYQKMGYTIIGTAGPDGVLFEKVILARVTVQT